MLIAIGGLHLATCALSGQTGSIDNRTDKALNICPRKIRATGVAMTNAWCWLRSGFRSFGALLPSARGPTPATVIARLRLKPSTTLRVSLAEVLMRGLALLFFCVAALSAPVATAQAPNYQGLWWGAPAGSESGWGINFAHQGDIIFATWFTYDTTGKAWWLTMTANKTAANTYSGALYQTKGPAFSAVPFSPSQVTATAVGSGTLTFSDASTGTFAYMVNGVSQTKAITREVFGALPTCTFGGQTNLALADELPGPVVGRTGRVRIRVGHQPHASGRHHLRQLVHVRHRRHAAVAGSDGAEDNGGDLHRALCIARPVRGSTPHRSIRQALWPRQ